MTTHVAHRERLAWDAARLVVRALGSDQVMGWLRGQLAARLGPAHAAALTESRNRMWASTRADAPQVEAGIWRARLEDLLVADRALAGPLCEIMGEVEERLAFASDIRVHGEAEPAEGPRVIDLDRPRP